MRRRAGKPRAAARPSTIGRYEILREVGRGAMGVVYEARDPALDRTIALKVIQPSAEKGETARVFEERFLAEARIAAQLQHPGIVVVHDVGRDTSTGTLFIALELLRGQTLADLGAKGPLDWRTVLHLVAQAARALHHAHRHGVVHRDIKPANVVVLPSGEVKVMDFGIARLETARHRLTTTGEFIGTPLYTAPEQAKTEEVDGRADVFSLASVAYTLLTGQAAFSAATIPGIVHRVVYEEPAPLSRFVRDVPPDVEHVLARALAKDPAQRYPTAEALAEDAEDVLAGRPPRHLSGETLVVVGEPESPLAALLDPSTVAAASRPSTPLPAGATRSILPVGRRRLRRLPVLAAVVAAALGLVALLLWGPWRPRAAPHGPLPSRKVATPAPAAPASGASRHGPLAALLPANPGRLRIDFDHPLRRGTLRVFVDDELALEQRLTGQEKKKALLFKLHEGTFREELDVPTGLHEVRMEVRWDDSVRTERIVGSFRSGVTRRLEASLGRIRRDLKLEWQ
jgi:eukaryotic-like serine/threonine-protein kinase